MKIPNFIRSLTVLALVSSGLLAPSRAPAVGWTPLATTAPAPVMLMLLLPDGSVLAANNDDFTFGNAWYKLTPVNGSYVNGIWTTVAPAHYTRLFFASQVLPTGNVFVAGGEYGTGTTNAEIYNPNNNLWSIAPNTPGAVKFVDAISDTLPNGNVLIAPVNPATSGGTLIWNTASSTWSTGPQLYRGGNQAEAFWLKLRDGSLLTVDALDDGGDTGLTSDRYIPSLNQWVPDGPVPVQLYANLCGSKACFVGEAGPGFLLPNGNGFFVGGTGATAIYQPSGSPGTTNFGTWTAGPPLPNGQAAPDAPGAMMVNGKVLCAVSLPPTLSGSNVNFPSPTSFYEYDYSVGSNGSFTQVNGPTGQTDNVSPFVTVMLDLPDGSVLYADRSSQLYVYNSPGSPLAAGKPAINSITANSDGSYHLTGTKLNGLSEGAAYGDDAQMNSNYPLVRFISGGNIYYGRTFNWSTTGVQTGSAVVSTDFFAPTNLPPGNCSLVVVANGFASDAVTFTGPIWVDFNYSGVQTGTFEFPWETLASGISAVVSGQTIYINASSQPSTSSEHLTISKAMTITSVSGPSTIGR